MRRTQSVRHHQKASIAMGSDDLGMLKEGDESPEDILRRQLLEKDKENDKLQNIIIQLRSQLAERPPLESVQRLQKEYTNLDILLQGTQRENERCMAELERAKTREKALECHLEKLAGPNWQENLDFGGPYISARGSMMSPGHARSNSVPHVVMSTAPPPSQSSDAESTKAYIEQVRLLVLGMEQRLKTREEKLAKVVEDAETEGARFDEAKRQALTT